MGDEDKMGKRYVTGKKAEDLGIREVVLEEICRLAEQYGVEKVLLFGSRARGDFWLDGVLVFHPGDAHFL